MLTDTTILNAEVFQSALRAKGFRSARELADAVGVHRNTISGYLSGAAVLPQALEKMLQALDLAPAEVLQRKVTRRELPGLAVQNLCDRLQKEIPQSALVLFGSRARGNPKPLSDYDLGIYSAKKIPFAVFSRMLTIVDTWNDKHEIKVQLVNLTNAEEFFLQSVREDLLFLCGRMSDWTLLLRRCGIEVYER